MDEDAFTCLYAAHADDVWRYARRRCSSAERADDVLGETFAVAWRRRDDLPGPPDDRLWLLGTARRVLANQRRGDRRRDGLRERLVAVRSDPGPTDPAEVVGDDGDALWAALASLPDDQRDLLMMRAWDGLAVTDMATLLGCSSNAASIRLTRARQQLATALERERSTAPRTPRERNPTTGGGTDDRP